MDKDAFPQVLIERHATTFVPERVRQRVQIFLHTEASGGIVLFFAALVALAWVNSPLSDSYDDLWSTVISLDFGVVTIVEDLRHLLNDGFMTVFFFVVGLEIKRELAHGELSDPRRAALPAAAALGGMAVPAIFYLAFNLGGDGSKGWGIPMATDIAFAVGVLSLLGARVSLGLRIFLLALAIVDDIGAILVIAFFYTSELSFMHLAMALATLLAVLVMNNRGVRNVNVYALAGLIMWVAMLKSGVHPTLTGVVLGLLTPAIPFYRTSGFANSARSLVESYEDAERRESRNDREEILEQVEDLTAGSQSPLHSLEKALHPWVSFMIMPTFALANAGVAISVASVEEALANPISHGIFLGLVLGKPVGIVLFSWLAIKLNIATLPTSASWPQVAGVGLVAGIGFTVSLFITGLAFTDAQQIDVAKLSILAASLTAGLLSYLLLKSVSTRLGSSGA